MLLDLLLDLLLHLVPGGQKRRARKLLAEGQTVRGRIDAILVTPRNESPDFWDYGVEIDGRRYGLRQWLEPERGRAVPGAMVILRRLDGKVLIDWPATLDLHGSLSEDRAHSVDGWKPLDKPPPPGLHGVTAEQLHRRAG